MVVSSALLGLGHASHISHQPGQGGPSAAACPPVSGLHSQPAPGVHLLRKLLSARGKSIVPFRPPSQRPCAQVLLDGNFIHAARSCGLPEVDKHLENLLGGRAKTYVTPCVMAELRGLGTEVRRSVKAVGTAAGKCREEVKADGDGGRSEEGWGEVWQSGGALEKWRGRAAAEWKGGRGGGGRARQLGCVLGTATPGRTSHRHTVRCA
eukprot:361723-Chlamydomonas_euryale.AAC.9